jgi:hypothetical protein
VRGPRGASQRHAATQCAGARSRVGIRTPNATSSEVPAPGTIHATDFAIERNAMLSIHEQNPYLVTCYDCGRDFDLRDEPRAIAGQRCPAAQCDSNHQPRCNIAAGNDEIQALCRCDGVPAGTTRALKPSLSQTGMTTADYAHRQADTDLVNAIVALDGQDPDRVVLTKIRELLCPAAASVGATYYIAVDGQGDVIILAHEDGGAVIAGFAVGPEDHEGTCTKTEADVLESFLLALACEGVNLSDPAISKALRVTLETLANEV